MSEALYRVRDREALNRVLSAGIRVLHRFGDELVLARPLDRDIDGVTRVTDLAFVMPEQLREEDLGGLAYRLRQTAEYRANKARREHAGVSMDLVIRGKAGDYA